jgi:hypothetical protein
MSEPVFETPTAAVSELANAELTWPLSVKWFTDGKVYFSGWDENI